MKPCGPQALAALQQLGMRGGFLRPNPYKDRMLHDPSYEPFWTMAEELDRLSLGGLYHCCPVNKRIDSIG
jgi:hypothetical protein